MPTRQSILEVVIDPTKAEAGARRASEAYGRFTSSFDKQSKRIQEQFNKFAKATISATDRMTKRMISSWKSFSDFIGTRVISAIKRGFIGAINSAWNSVSRLLSVLGPAGLIGAINEIIQAGLKIQKFGITFSVISGNLVDARKELQGLIALNQKLGSSFEAAAAPAAKFFAASKDSLVSSDIRNIFEAFSEVSVALQLNKQEVTGVFLALQQIASKGRVSMEELRLQLAERVPGAMQLAAKSMGMSMKDFEDSVRKGTINSSEFLINFGKILHEEFGPAAAIASELGQSAINRFETALLLFFNTIAESGVLQSFQNFLDTIRVKFLENARVAEVLGGAITSIVDRFTTFVGQISDRSITESVVGVANAFVLIYNTILDIIPSMTTLSNAIKVVAGYVIDVAEFFSGSQNTGITDQEKVLKRLNEELAKSMRWWERNTSGAREFGTSAFKAFQASDEAKEMWQRMITLERQIEATKQKIIELRNEAEKPIDGPKRLEMFKAEDFLGRTKPTLTPDDSPLEPTEDEMQRHLSRVRDLVGQSNDLLESTTKRTLVAMDKLDKAREAMLEQQVRMLDAERIAANPDADMGQRLIAADKLLNATKDFVDARAKFEDLFAQKMQQERERLTTVVDNETESMTEFLSFGNEFMRTKLMERQMDVQAAADMQIITQQQANEIMETMEEQHLAKMGDLRAQYALRTKEFENQTNKQRVNSLLADIVKTTGIVSGSNKKLFELNKKARIAQAVMELPGAVMTSFARGGGFPWGLIPAGITLASGLQHIQDIRSASFSGGGGSSSISAGSAGSVDLTSSTPTPVVPASDAVFTRSINSDPNTVDSSPVNINFNIEAMDGASVQRVINSQRGNIISIVQSAYTERGRNGGPVS